MSLSRIDRRAVVVAAGVAAAVALLLLFAPAALAATTSTTATNGNDIGGKAGSWLSDQAHQLFLGITAIVALIFLLNRRYTELGVFMVAVIVVGWLIYSPDLVAGFARHVANVLFS